MQKFSYKKEFFTQREVNLILNFLPTRTLIALAKENVVDSEVDFADHRGIHRKYSLAHLRQIAVVTALAGSGWSYSTIKEVVADPFLKGNDSNGQPKISSLINKFMVILCDATSESIEYESDSRLVYYRKCRRKWIYNVFFYSDEELRSQIIKVDKMYKSPSLDKQPIAVITLDLSIIDDLLHADVNAFLKAQRSLVNKKLL
ncbi:MAG: hypothetical protein FJ126_12505 [Deltaproteobacteria bacterium]|nr:hypothetical protein [Deltaproteobacteria bacterium]